jgi:hypothetical protein
VFGKGLKNECWVCFTQPETGLVVKAAIDCFYPLNTFRNDFLEDCFTSLTEQPKGEPERKYPYFGVANQGESEERVVYFTEPATGIQVHEKTNVWGILHYDKLWVESDFTPLPPETQIIITT